MQKHIYLSISTIKIHRGQIL